jgi:hypothetical protein
MQVQASALAYADTEPAGVSTISDPAAALLALMLRSNAAQSGAARVDIDHATQVIEDTRRQIKEAMQRAADAQEHSGFWNKLSDVFSGDIGALCELVAAAAVVAATGGVGAAGVLAISAAAFSVSGEVAKRAGASPAVCSALAGVGALAGMAVGNVGGASAAWQAVATSAKGAGALATGGGIGATVVADNWQATAMDRQADATAARGEQSVAASDYDLALGQLERAARDASRAGSTAANIMQTENDGRMSLVARLGAA